MVLIPYTLQVNIIVKKSTCELCVVSCVLTLWDFCHPLIYAAFLKKFKNLKVCDLFPVCVCAYYNSLTFLEKIPKGKGVAEVILHVTSNFQISRWSVVYNVIVCVCVCVFKR